MMKHYEVYMKDGTMVSAFGPTVLEATQAIGFSPTDLENKIHAVHELAVEVPVSADRLKWNGTAWEKMKAKK